MVPSLVILGGLFLASAGLAADDHGNSHSGCGHAHVAPHGGTLIPVGDHALHVELLLDAEDGMVRLYVLGSHAEKPARIAAPELTIDLASIGDHAASERSLVLKAVPSALTGETVGDTSEFAASHPELIGASGFTGELRALDARGFAFTNIAVSGLASPADHDHDHDHDHGHAHHHDHAGHHHDH